MDPNTSWVSGENDTCRSFLAAVWAVLELERVDVRGCFVWMPLLPLVGSEQLAFPGSFPAVACSLTRGSTRLNTRLEPMVDIVSVKDARGEFVEGVSGKKDGGGMSLIRRRSEGWDLR